jgi:hypothetical protein
MEFSSLYFLLWPDDGSGEPKLVAKNAFLERSVAYDCIINKNKYTLVTENLLSVNIPLRGQKYNCTN